MADARVAVVTGANRGIGQEVARQFKARGFRVIATSRAPGSGFATLDVEDRTSIQGFARALAKGGVDVLVNNAGASFDGFDASVAKSTLAVNFFGPMHLTDALLPSMRAGARIVMVSSGMGKLSNLGPTLRARFEDPSLTRAGLLELLASFVRDVGAGVHGGQGWPSNAYSVSKIGLNALVRVLARELEGDARGILVNSADPGWVRTRMGGPAAPVSVEDGAKTPVYLALLPAGGPTGGFFARERKIGF
jgi:carbonyl reductase 1